MTAASQAPEATSPAIELLLRCLALSPCRCSNTGVTLNPSRPALSPAAPQRTARSTTFHLVPLSFITCESLPLLWASTYQAGEYVGSSAKAQEVCLAQCQSMIDTVNRHCQTTTAAPIVLHGKDCKRMLCSHRPTGSASSACYSCHIRQLSLCLLPAYALA